MSNGVILWSDISPKCEDVKVKFQKKFHEEIPDEK